jgi:hypothetical protein
MLVLEPTTTSPMMLALGATIAVGWILGVFEPSL